MTLSRTSVKNVIDLVFRCCVCLRFRCACEVKALKLLWICVCDEIILRTDDAAGVSSSVQIPAVTRRGVVATQQPCVTDFTISSGASYCKSRNTQFHSSF